MMQILSLLSVLPAYAENIEPRSSLVLSTNAQISGVRTTHDRVFRLCNGIQRALPIKGYLTA